MMCYTRDYSVLGLCPSSGILNNTEQDRRKQISMPRVGFEATTPVFEREYFLCLSTATEIDIRPMYLPEISIAKIIIG
jgi:hypothetical protein